MPAAKKKVPVIEHYWTTANGEWVVNTRIKGANGEIVATIEQGARDKHGAMRSVRTLTQILSGYNLSAASLLLDTQITRGELKEKGPGKKPAPITTSDAPSIVPLDGLP